MSLEKMQNCIFSKRVDFVDTLNRPLSEKKRAVFPQLEERDLRSLGQAAQRAGKAQLLDGAGAGAGAGL